MKIQHKETAEHPEACYKQNILGNFWYVSLLFTFRLTLIGIVDVVKLLSVVSVTFYTKLIYYLFIHDSSGTVHKESWIQNRSVKIWHVVIVIQCVLFRFVFLFTALHFKVTQTEKQPLINIIDANTM